MTGIVPGKGTLGESETTMRRRAAAPVDEDDPKLLERDPEPEVAPRRGPGRPRKVAGNAGLIPARDESGKIMSEAQMIAKVRDELHLWLSMAVGAWEFRDPDCAGLFLEKVEIRGRKVERLEAICDRLVSIIARNKTLLATMTKTGVIGEAAALGTLIWPVAKAMMAAHGPNGHQHRADPEQGETDDLSYPAWRPSVSVG
jgi:hypothetical protein